MIVCKECGQHNPDGSVFCSNCPAYLPHAGEHVPDAPAAAEEEPEEAAEPAADGRQGIVRKIRDLVEREPDGDEAPSPEGAPAPRDPVPAAATAASAGALRESPPPVAAELPPVDEAAEEAARQEALRDEEERLAVEERARQVREAAQREAAERKAAERAERERQEQQEREAAEREAAERAEREAAEREAREAAERKERAEREQQERQEREAAEREAAQREEAERQAAEQERKEREARERRERAEREQQEREEREARERKEREEREERERQERETRKAAEAAETARRAAAMVAKPPPAKPTPPPRRRGSAASTTDAAPTTSDAAATGAVDGDTPPAGEALTPEPVMGVRAPTEQRPSASVQRPPVRKKKQPPTRKADPGDVICGHCGEPNKPDRNFCRRCAESLAEAEVVRGPWWRRLVPKRRDKTVEAGTRRGRTKGGPKAKRHAAKKAGRKVVRVVRALAMVAGLLAVVGVIGPWRGPVMERVDGVYQSARRLVIPEYVPVNAINASASSALAEHPAELVIDGFENTHWSSAPGGDDPSILVITFDREVDLARVGFLSGATGEDFLAQPRPQRVHFVYAGGSTTLDLVDTAEFQDFKLDAAGVTEVEMQIQSVYASREGTSVSISEMEFFTKR
jgi:hypothetical protein